MAFKQTFRCNTCGLVFEESQTQRSHMRGPWHIYNLKRRLESLPTVSIEEYTDQIATDLVLGKQRSDTTGLRGSTESGRQHTPGKAVRSEDFVEESRKETCLFCNETSDSLDVSLQHMSTEHDFFIPEMEYLSSPESFINYLRQVVTEYHECLYCGIKKDSSGGVRRHMLDKNHCMFNPRREPELLEFWDLSDMSSDEEIVPTIDQRADTTPAPGHVAQDECRLPSGRVMVSKSKAREAKAVVRRTASKTKDKSDQTSVERLEGADGNSPPKPLSLIQQARQGRPEDLSVSTRDAFGLIGVSNQQMRSLVTLQKKMQRQDAAVRASASWVDELGGRG